MYTVQYNVEYIIYVCYAFQIFENRKKWQKDALANAIVREKYDRIFANEIIKEP